MIGEYSEYISIGEIENNPSLILPDGGNDIGLNHYEKIISKP